MIFAIFNLVGYIPGEIERFIISASILLSTFDQYFNSWVGNVLIFYSKIFGYKLGKGKQEIMIKYIKKQQVSISHCH